MGKGLSMSTMSKETKMEVKMTRTERAIRKAQKAAKVAYKLAKAPTPYEFTNPVDLMTKEEKFQWELEKYFEDIKGTQYYDEVMSTCKWLLNDEETWVSESTTGRELAQWVFDEYYRIWAEAERPELKEEYKDFVGSTNSIMEHIDGFNVDWNKLRNLISQLYLQDIKSYFLEGKFRMLKKHSKIAKDVLEAYGLAGYIPKYNRFGGGHKRKSAEACAKALKAGLKVNVKGLKQALNVKGKIHHEQWPDVLGYILLGVSGIGLNSSLHLENTTNFRAVPEHMKKLVAQNDRAIHWCFFTDLDIDWTMSKNSAKNCIIKSIAQKFGYSEEEAASMFENPASAKAIKFVNEEGPAVEEHTMPLTADVVDEDGYKVSLMPKKDIRNLYIGEITGCCQKLGGHGEDVCIEGWKDKHSANYVLTTASGTILGHFWLYEAVNGGYVIDSVESRQSLDVEKLTTLVKSWVSAVRPNHKLYISDCSYGITQKVIATLRKGFSLLAEEEPAPAFKPEGHYEY